MVFSDHSCVCSEAEGIAKTSSSDEEDAAPQLGKPAPSQGHASAKLHAPVAAQSKKLKPSAIFRRKKKHEGNHWRSGIHRKLACALHLRGSSIWLVMCCAVLYCCWLCIMARDTAHTQLFFGMSYMTKIVYLQSQQKYREQHLPCTGANSKKSQKKRDKT